MNRLILKHGKLVTTAILLVLGWFIYRQFIVARSPLFPFVVIVAVIWALGAFLFIYYWPAITCNAFKRAILQRGMGGGPIPVNSLYAVPDVASPSASASSLMATGAEDLLYVMGWLDLSAGPQVLHVPDFSGHYYSIQFTDPTDGTNFAYVGKRATGTQAADFLITTPGWQGTLPPGMTRIVSPHPTMLVFGRALVENSGDVAAVYARTSQIQLTPFSSEGKAK